MLKDKTELEKQDSASNERDRTNNITAIEEKISELQVRYKQKKQNMEQEKSILVTKDMLHTGKF